MSKKRDLGPKIAALNAEAARLRATRVARATALAAEAYRLARIAGDRSGAADAQTRLADCHLHRGRYLEALVSCRKALVELGPLADRIRQALILRMIGNVYTLTGRYRKAIASYRRSLELSWRDDPRNAFHVQNNLGTVHTYLGEPAAAHTHYAQALTLARGAGDRSQESIVLMNLGNLLKQAGDLAGAARHMTASLRLRRAIGDTIGEAEVLCNLGELECRQGRPARALATLARCLELCDAADDDRTRVYALINQAEARGKAGDPAAGARDARAAATLARRQGDARAALAAALVLGRLLAADDRAAAAAEFRKVAAKAAALGEKAMAKEAAEALSAL